MLKLQLLTSKETQFNALQFVRRVEPQEDSYRMGKRIDAIMGKERGSVSFTHVDYINTTRNPHINDSTYFQQSSQADLTITQYKGNTGADTKLYTNSGIKYPYENIIKFVINFPSGFRDLFLWEFFHYPRSDCLQGTWVRYDYERNQDIPV